MKPHRLSSCIAAAVCAVFVAITSGSATLVGPGDNFKVSFDLTGRGPAASYDNVGFVLDFTSLDYLDQNEGFSFQVFDNSGATNSSVTNFLYTLPVSTPNLGGQAQVFTPMNGSGYFLFTNIIGTFDIGGPNLYGFGTMQTAYGFDSVTSGFTGVFPATFGKIGSVPDFLNTGLLLAFSFFLLLGACALKAGNGVHSLLALSRIED